MKKIKLNLLIFLFTITSVCSIHGQNSRPIVNQAGYNLGEAKRFVCYGAKDGIDFQIIKAEDVEKKNPEIVYTGKINNYAGDFSDFNPQDAKYEFIIRVSGHSDSHPFWIADHLIEKLSSRLAYQFFIDVRGSVNPIYSNEVNVAGGGPSRDVGAYGLEAVFETMLYASNPALFDRWYEDFGKKETPDLIQLILWHAEFAFHHRDYNGPTGHRPYYIGHPDEKPQTYDYQNTLDQLAAVCAAYHSFLKPHLEKEKYQRYRQVCLQNWERYERDQVVRYWVNSRKWVDKGWQEFNEMGNVFGQAVFRNLFMYLAEKNEEDGQAEKFMSYAHKAAKDIIDNWDFNNPRHMWWIRNGEHITPQALAFFLLVAPEDAPQGTKEKLMAWADHMKNKTNNFWHYRKHSKTEWAHPKTKELGNTGLGGSMFAVAYLLDDPKLRAIGWSQVNQVFGLNPAEAHYSNKSLERLKIGGYWEGIEKGWSQAYPNGAGMLGLVRGTLDGTPLDNAFPYKPNTKVKLVKGKMDGKTTYDKQSVINYYATEGWGITNRAWMSSLIFSTLKTTQIQLLNTKGQVVDSAKRGEKITIKLRAALNQDWNTKEKGWVLVTLNDNVVKKIEVTETGKNTGVFTTSIDTNHSVGDIIKVNYGFMGFKKTASLILR